MGIGLATNEGASINDRAGWPGRLPQRTTYIAEQRTHSAAARCTLAHRQRSVVEGCCAATLACPEAVGRDRRLVAESEPSMSKRLMHRLRTPRASRG